MQSFREENAKQIKKINRNFMAAAHINGKAAINLPHP